MGKRKKLPGFRRFSKIGGQFSARVIEMMESPAFRVLSLSAHCVLDRIEIEQAHHGGHDNGALCVTYLNFVEYGNRPTRDCACVARVGGAGFPPHHTWPWRQRGISRGQQIYLDVSTHQNSAADK